MFTVIISSFSITAVINLVECMQESLRYHIVIIIVASLEISKLRLSLHHHWLLSSNWHCLGQWSQFRLHLELVVDHVE